MLEHLLLPLGQTGAGSLAEADHLGGVDQHDEGPVGAAFTVDDDQLGFEKAPGSSERSTQNCWEWFCPERM